MDSQKEVERLRLYTAGLETALKEAGGDPTAVKAAVDSRAAGEGGDTGGSTANGGGSGNPVVEAALRAELKKTQDMLRMAREETAEASTEAEEARKSAEQAMKEV
eukprot:SAG31_NODE_8449_length_1450_cov_0.987417_1_plen_105_part_00